jgi:hypothetical protein
MEALLGSEEWLTENRIVPSLIISFSEEKEKMFLNYKTDGSFSNMKVVNNVATNERLIINKKRIFLSIGWLRR